MDLALLIFLVLINGIFAMSEMALAASRKARLQVMAETGDAGAVAAMSLHDNPTQFLSTVQIGITSIGVLNGIVGEAAFSPPLAEWLLTWAPITERAAIERQVKAILTPEQAAKLDAEKAKHQNGEGHGKGGKGDHGGRGMGMGGPGGMM